MIKYALPADRHKGVTLFSIDSEEKVVSVGLIQEKDTSDDEPVDTTDTPSTDPSIENESTEKAETTSDDQENGAET